MNVAALFEEQASAAADAPCLAWEGGPMAYRDVASLTRRMAAALATRGIAPGDRVALLLGNHPAFAVALLGILRRGAVAVVLSPAWAPADSARALQSADVRLLITSSSLGEAHSADVDIMFVIDDAAPVDAWTERLPECASADAGPPFACDASTPATILYSSGTTGDPKGVVLTHGNLAFNARMKRRYCGITARDRLAMVVPMSHCFGQNVVLLGALLSGASVQLFPRFDAERVRDAIAKGRVSMLLAAPTAFERLLALPDASPLRRVRYALSAAAPMSASLAARWREATGIPLAQGYGMTECSPFAAYTPDATAAPQIVGHAIAGVDVAIERPDGSYAGIDEAGEITIHGPNVMAGYWRRPEDTARALRGGWLHTGDIGALDANGSVHLIDRLDDVINVAGFKAWPSDVERVLASHPDVRESAVYALPDPVRGSSVAAAVVLRPGASVTAGDLQRYIAPRLAGFQRPARLHVVADLPRSPSGKVLRRALAVTDQRERHSTPA